jgi:molybdate transport system regulatory protein
MVIPVRRQPGRKLLRMHIDGRFWIEHDGHHLAGRGRIELLERIRDSGSISKAAKSMKMGYKAAWDMVDDINQAASQPVVLRTTGGRTGGGSQLTSFGQALIDAYRSMERQHREFLEALHDRFAGVLMQKTACNAPAQTDTPTS